MRPFRTFQHSIHSSIKYMTRWGHRGEGFKLIRKAQVDQQRQNKTKTNRTLATQQLHDEAMMIEVCQSINQWTYSLDIEADR